MKYFAYGSNMSHKQMATRCPDSSYIARATLDDYKFVYDGYSETWKGAGANIVAAPGRQVVGGVYEVSESDLAVLDGFEIGYNSRVLTVRMSDGSACEVVTYCRNPLQEGLPSEAYAAAIGQGKKDCGIAEPVEVVWQKQPS